MKYFALLLLSRLLKLLNRRSYLGKYQKNCNMNDIQIILSEQFYVIADKKKRYIDHIQLF